MKHKSIFLFAIIASLASFILSSCDDELYRTNSIGSELKESGDYKISRFAIDKTMWNIPEGTEEIQLSLISQTDNSELTFKAQVEQKNESTIIAILIPKDEKIPDSDYHLTATLPDGTIIGRKIDITVRYEMVHKILGSSKLLNFRYGDGSKENPYLINSSDDFNQLLYELYCDSVYHCAGLYFKQTADFRAPACSDNTVGRFYQGYTLAGSYDGGGHTITLFYQGTGSDKDNNVGLFTSLIDGAEVKSLNISTLIEGVNENSGALAGSCSGNVLVSDVTVAGSIKGNTNIGAFIGKATGSLKVQDCRLSATLSGKNYVGGIVGQVYDGAIQVDGFSTSNKNYETTFFSVSASENYAGGVAGAIFNSSCDINDVSIYHTVSQEDKDLKVVNAAGEKCGGIAGEATIRGMSAVKDFEIVAPICAGKSYVGGIFGKVECYSKLNVQSCTIGAYITAQEYVGGFFGHIKTRGNLAMEGSASRVSNRICQVDNSYIAIEGNKYVGGLYGYIDGDTKIEATTKLNVNITAKSNFAGGIAGKSEWSTIDCTHFSIDPHMIVQGPDAIGGIVGYAHSSTIKGSIPDDDIQIKSYPAASNFKSSFGGRVTCEVLGSSCVGGTSIGGIAGYAYDTYIENICCDGTVVGASRVGGIVGHLQLSSRGGMKKCVSNVTEVSNNWGVSTGGVVGELQYKTGSIIDLINYGSVKGQDYTGGIIGYVNIDYGSNNFSIHSCLNMGNVTGSKNVGGCLGYLYKYQNTPTVEIYNMGNTGNVTSNEEGNIGGIIGYCYAQKAKVLKSANHGDISSSGNSKVGGIVGRLGINGDALSGAANNAEMGYCCNRGSISSSHSASNVGGLLGYQEDGQWNDEENYMVHDCYNAGEVTSDQDDDNGGIVGYVDNFGEVVRCVNFGKVAYGNAMVGTHKSGTTWYHHNLYFLKNTGKDWCGEEFSESDKSKESTYENFDFGSVWKIDTSLNDGFPHLQSCPFQFPPK